MITARRFSMRWLGLAGLSGLALILPFSGNAFAQEETSTETAAPAASKASAPDDAARQQAAEKLHRLGVSLDWHKATLAELKQTQADLIAAGDDEDLRLRVVLAARLRELGITVNWRRFTSDELMEQYTAAKADVPPAEPAPKPRRPARKPARPVNYDDSVSYEAPSANGGAEVRMSAAEYDALRMQASQQYVQPVLVAPTLVVPSCDVITTPRFPSCGTTTYTTSDGLTITTNGAVRYRDGNCGPNYGNGTVRRYQPGAPLTPRGPQNIINLPGGRPGAPGVIPIQHPKIDWMFNNNS